MRALAGIADYEPTELVVTAPAGTPLAELEALLAEQASACRSSRRTSAPAPRSAAWSPRACRGRRARAAGSVRDHVLGATLLNGRGELLHFGGQVIKNVAGYDVSRLLAGSLGTLGVILEVSLKVLPRAAAKRPCASTASRPTRSRS